MGSGRLDGFRTLVVGASRGIGTEIARAYAAEGAIVAATARGEDDAMATAGELGPGAVGIALDLADPASVVAGVDEAVGRLGAVDVLVQNGGVTSNTPLLDLSGDEWRRVLGTNLDGTFTACQRVARHLVDRGAPGSIIVVTSQVAEVAQPNKAAYATSKAGLTMLVKSMALELAPHGIRANCLAPGAVDTDMNRGRFRRDPEALAATQRRIPMGRLGDASEMAGAAVFLASSEASYVTGTTLLVDGGYLAT